MTTNLEYCNFYSDKGWRVFPVGNDKKPMVKDWPNEATTDRAKIAAWWGTNPNAGIGLATGKQSKIFAVDIDAGHGGFDSLAKLPTMPETVVSNTGGGGKHFLFKYPTDIEVRNTASKIGAGIDSRGEGGYIVVPRSPHPSGHFYEWDKEHLPSKYPVAPAPAWLLKLMVDDKPQVMNTPAEGAYISGQRNNALTSMAGAMKRKGFTEESIFLALNAENLNRCVPPLSETEVRVIAASVSRYEAQGAMPLTNRDRATAEWGLIKSVYEWPNIINEYPDIQSSDFAQAELGNFWQSIRSGIDSTQAAANCGLMAELEKSTGYEFQRVEGYAKAIKTYSYLSKIATHAETIKHHAVNGNMQGLEKSINDINKVPSQSVSRIISIGDVFDELDREMAERKKNPSKIWGVPYAWDYISELTGGKHHGELTYLVAEPKIGKSWWFLQDALYTAVEHDTPVFYWCGEMRRGQLLRRFCQLLGMNGRNIKSGNLTEQDEDLYSDAKSLIMNSPLYIDDKPLALHEIRPLLVKQIAEHGIKQAVFDYARLIQSPGKDENEQSKNTSIELKRICQDLDIALMVIASVNKQGMDSKTETATKSNISGSGQQVHDADNLYFMTKFNGPEYGMAYGIQPEDYDSVKAIHLTASRELDHQVEGGFIAYQQKGTPKFSELRRLK